MKFLVTLLFLFIPILCYSQYVESSFTKSFPLSALFIDNNLSGNIEEDKGDEVIFLHRNGKLIVEYKYFGAAGSLCYLYASLPNYDNDDFTECYPVKIEDVKILHLGPNFIIINSLDEYAFTIMESPDKNGSYSLFINEPALTRKWFK